MGFNTPNTDSSNSVFTAIVNQIHVDGTNVKVLPAGTPPTVVYRIGDGTVHPDGFENTDGFRYLDFYVSTGAQGAKGDKGEDGLSAYEQAVQGGYSGTQEEFYTLLTEVTSNAVLAYNSATAAVISETNAENSATASEASATNSAASALASANSATESSGYATDSSVSATSSSNSASSASASASAASDSATNALGSANAAAISETNSASSETNAATSETNASNSATSASNSASSAAQSAIDAQAVVGNEIGLIGDVDTTGKQDGDALVYNSTSGNWEASSIAVPIPTFTITTTMNENETVTGTITNYNSEYGYTITADNGVISNISGSTFSYTAPSVTDAGVSAPYTDVVRITCTFGFFTSPEATETITYIYVPIVADTAYQVVDFTGEASFNDGFDLI